MQKLVCMEMSMNISDENKARLNLLTTQDVAEILKLNIQVVAKKLKTGEMEGYKLGKDWRISEIQLMNYLEKNCNKKTKLSEQDRVISTYLKNDKLQSIPATRKKRQYILEFLVSKLDADKVYTEKEINSFLKLYHDDVCTLRREFIMNKMMIRKDGKYKVIKFIKSGDY